MDKKTMLHRCSSIYTLILLTLVSFLEANEKLDPYQKQGKALGRSFKFSELSTTEIRAITPEELQGKDFDGEAARKQLNNSTYINIEKFPTNELDPVIIAIVENAEHSLQTISSSETTHETIEKCTVENHIQDIVLTHKLNVDVSLKPKISKTIKICNGHTSKEKTDSPEYDRRHQMRRFEADPSIKSYSVEIKNKGLGHRDLIVCKWVHVDNATCCDCCSNKEIEISPASIEETDTWNIQNPEILDSLDCTLVKTVNGPKETRIISGKAITRPLWIKTQHFQCIKKNNNSCEFLEKNNCVLTTEKCIKQIMNKCQVWEKTFKCQARKVRTNSFSDTYGTDSNLWDTSYQQNKDLADVATKLSIFDEMKKELQNSEAPDVRSVQLFKGSEEQCSKSVAEDIMYDCCNDMDGLATKLKLSKCTSDEIALAESRRKGLCHYLGVKEEKFLGLWISRKEHVFCVFPSKLSRVFQEAARDQLNISWGTAENPNCRGLTQDEIKKLDFSKLDISEAFDLPEMPNHSEKIQKIEGRLKQRIEAM